MATNAALLLGCLLCLSRNPNAKEMGDIKEEGDLEKNDTVSFNKSASQCQGFYQNTITETTVTLTPTIAVSVAISSTTELSKQPSDCPSSHHHYHNLISRSRHSLKQLLKPCTVVIILLFAISLMDPVKVLFILPSLNFQPHFWPTAPGRQPLLAIIYNTATFIGGACIPLGLICLGSALACLSLRLGGLFPKGTIALLALGRMVVNPIIGVVIIRGFVYLGYVNRDDKVSQFVCMCIVS